MRYDTKDGYLHFTAHKGVDNKMFNMISLNTSTVKNKFCQKMQKCNEFVCARCYAQTLESLRKLITPPFAKNGELLSKRLLRDNEIPILNIRLVRFDAFGELINKTHYRNLIQIVEANPTAFFALWTKRADLIKNDMKRLKNMNHVFSSPRMNVVAKEQSKLFDKVFTVYNAPYVREHNVKINCSKSCFKCGICYSKNRTKYIHELVR